MRRVDRANASSTLLRREAQTAPTHVQAGQQHSLTALF